MSNFTTLTPVEIFGLREFVGDCVTINVNRVMVLRVMGQEYGDYFSGKAEGYYATASIQPDTFREGTLLSAPPTRRNYPVLHWWLTKEEYVRVMGVRHDAGQQ